MAKGTALLSKAFPFRDFDIDFLWAFFEDIEDGNFEAAVLGIINNCEDIKNIIPLVQKFALEAKRLRRERMEKIQDQTSDPPPEEWEKLKAKLGLK